MRGRGWFKSLLFYEMQVMEALCVVFTLLFVQWSTGQVMTVQPKIDIFVTPQVVGGNVSTASDIQTPTLPVHGKQRYVLTRTLLSLPPSATQSLNGSDAAELRHTCLAVWVHRHRSHPQYNNPVGQC